MICRAIEISGQGKHLRKERGFLVVSEDRVDLAKLPIDDLEVVLLSSDGMTCTGGVFTTLAQRCIPLVVCDQRFVPCSVLWPVESHHLQSGRIRAQAAMSEPLRKRLWQQVVRAKILAQAEALHLCTGTSSPRLDQLVREVLSGDTTNVEGQAARLYWSLLFGDEFRRGRDLPGRNSLLNYGYTILRSAVARAVMLAGLHPAFALHHHNVLDTMPLVDDLIEPFRPVVDACVFDLTKHRGEATPLDAAAKQRLIAVTAVDLEFDGIASPLTECLLRMTRSLADVCAGTRRALQLPSGLKCGSSTQDDD